MNKQLQNEITSHKWRKCQLNEYYDNNYIYKNIYARDLIKCHYDKINDINNEDRFLIIDYELNGIEYEYIARDTYRIRWTKRIFNDRW